MPCYTNGDDFRLSPLVGGAGGRGSDGNVSYVATPPPGLLPQGEKEKRRSQTTVPKAVRLALELAYIIEPRRVVLAKAGTVVADDPFEAFSEWHSADDAWAYDGI